MERLQAEMRELRRMMGEHANQLAVLMDWRSHHEQQHQREENRHAEMPGRIFTTVLVFTSVMTFLLALYWGGFRP